MTLVPTLLLGLLLWYWKMGRKHTSLLTDVGTDVGVVSVWVSTNTALMSKLGLCLLNHLSSRHIQKP